jgi:tRNA 2-selenouridine synthase
MSLIDVRSPCEFVKGHIPGAQNVPLFSDEERAAVGTTYKQVGRQEAFTLGLEVVAPKAASSFYRIQGPVEIYCQRGGMRSEAVCKLLVLGGIQAKRREGGYKAFRRWVHEMIAKTRPFCVLGGLSGSGKTERLREMENVLDLEKLANHRGSSFGMLGQPPQPTQEHFENLLAVELDKLGEGPIWAEDESRMIGKCKIPDPLFVQLQAAPIEVMEVSREERLKRLIDEYGKFPQEQLIAATERLKRRLGTERMGRAIAHIQKGEVGAAAELVLDYYDQTYTYCLGQRGT